MAINPRKKSDIPCCAPSIIIPSLANHPSVRPSVRFHHSSFQFEARSRLRSGGHLAREGSRLENVIRRRIRGGGRLERTTWSHPRLNCWKCSVCTVDATLGSPDGRAGWGERRRRGSGGGNADSRPPRLLSALGGNFSCRANNCRQVLSRQGAESDFERDHLLVSRRQPRNGGMEEEEEEEEEFELLGWINCVPGFEN